MSQAQSSSKHSQVDSWLTETQNKVSKPSRESQSYCLSLLKFKLTGHAAAETQNKVSKPSREGQSYCLLLLKFKLTSHAAATIKPRSVRMKAPNGNKQSTAAKVPASVPKAMRKGQLLADVFSFIGHLLHFPAMFPVIDPNKSSSESVSGNDMSY